MSVLVPQQTSATIRPSVDSLIPVDCAVNDDHGCVGERITAIHFPGLELDALDMRGPRFREVKAHGWLHIKIGRRMWPCQHLLSCVGNIYWERYGLEPWTAAALLHWLRDEKTFTMDGGFEELWKWWESGITDHAHARTLLIDAAKDDRL